MAVCGGLFMLEETETGCFHSSGNGNVERVAGQEGKTGNLESSSLLCLLSSVAERHVHGGWRWDGHNVAENLWLKSSR
jgi:hypothetical protein